jgi:hypothetical protein
MKASHVNPILNAVILSASEGPHIRCFVTQVMDEYAISRMRDSSTPLRSARNDKNANRAFAHFRW